MHNVLVGVLFEAWHMLHIYNHNTSQILCPNYTARHNTEKCIVRRFTELNKKSKKFKKMVILMQYLGPDFGEHISRLAKHSQIFSKIQEKMWFHKREKFWRQKNVSTLAIWGNVWNFHYSNYDSFKIWNWHISKNISSTFRNYNIY